MDEYRTTEIAVEDVQSRLPALELSLSRVGVTAVEKVIRVDGGEWAPVPEDVFIHRVLPAAA